MKRILSLALAALLGLTGCAAPVCTAEQAPESSGGAQSAPGRWKPSLMALSEPVYPEFPQQPVLPEEGPEGAWEAYSEAYDRYIDALRAIRGDSPDLPQGTAASAQGGELPALTLYPGSVAWMRPLRLSAAGAMFMGLIPGIALLLGGVANGASLPFTLAAMGCIVASFVMMFW